MRYHREDDTKWPQKNKDGRQELEIRLGGEHISFEVSYPVVKTKAILLLTSCATDCEDRLIGGCQRVGRSGGSSSLLLPRPGPQGVGLLSDIAALQGAFGGLRLLATLAFRSADLLPDQAHLRSCNASTIRKEKPKNANFTTLPKIPSTHGICINDSNVEEAVGQFVCSHHADMV